MNSQIEGKKVLIFFPRNPLPFTNGNLKRFKQVLNVFLQKGARVHLLSANFFNGPDWNEESILALKAMGVREVSVYRMSALERKIRGHFRKKRKALKGNVFYTADLTPPFMGLWFWVKCMRFKPDIVLINYVWWSWMLRFLGGRKPVTVLEMHDFVTVFRSMRVELQSFINQDKVTLEGLEKIPDYLFSENYWDEKRKSPALKEIQECGKFDYVLAISRLERDAVKEKKSKTKAVLAPYSELPEDCGNFYGNFIFFPAGKHLFNLHGYLYFFKKIWPEIEREAPDLRVKVTGGFKDKVFNVDGIETLGFVPDLQSIYEKCRFVICPVIAGTGQIVKVVEAMARGLAVVTTRFGAEGSALVHGENGYIAENAEEFARFTIKLWRDEDLCRTMGRKAREASLKNFQNSPLNDFTDRLLGGAVKK